MTQSNLKTNSQGAPQYIVAALYKFATLEDYESLQPVLLDFCKQQDIRGTLLLAEEGINGTIAGTRVAVDAVLDFLRADLRLADIEHKESYADKLPFHRMKVKLKKEIVTIGIPEVNPNKAVGQYVTAEDWNALISDPEVLLIDTRNQYEVDIGTFKNAVNPMTTNFREFPEYVKKNIDPQKHKKVAMFCTGGIRCEKASSYMMSQGFDEVYHLQGGILKYIETVPAEQSLWEGDCFVFDSRVAVDHKLNYGRYDQCHGCRHPVTAADKRSSQYEEGVSCPYCFEHLTEEKRRSAAERHKQVKLAEARDQQHIGVTMEEQKRVNAKSKK